MSVTGAAARASSCRCSSEGKVQVVDVNVSDKYSSEGKQLQPQRGSQTATMQPRYHHTVVRCVCPLCNGNIVLDTAVTLQDLRQGDPAVGPLGPTPGGFGPFGHTPASTPGGTFGVGPLGPTPRDLGPLGRSPGGALPKPLVPPPSAAPQPRATMISDDGTSTYIPSTPSALVTIANQSCALLLLLLLLLLHQFC